MTAATFDIREHRASRVAAGLCIQCGETNDGETQTCAYHREAARQCRARYEATEKAHAVTRARVKAIGAAERKAEGRMHRDLLARVREAIVVDMARSLGRVPSTNDIADELGVLLPAAKKIRLRAFNLRRFRNDDRGVGTAGGWPVIPYPVPAEWQVTT